MNGLFSLCLSVSVVNHLRCYNEISTFHMNPDLEHLLSLQRADREIARLRQEIAALPKRIAAVEQKLATAHAQLDNARAQLKSGESTRRKHEADIQALQQKISKYREQSLDVKTNEQYKALLHEITFAEKGIREAEDTILETMVRAEDYEKTVRSAEAELKAQTAIIEKEKIEVRARTEQDEKELAQLISERESLRSQITESVLAHYDRVSKFRGSGVAEVKGTHCDACNVGLRPQVLNDLMTNEQVIPCSSCGRILIYPAAAPVEAPTEEASAAPVSR